MAWRIPPITWLRAPIGFTTRPTSCTATTRSTVTSPVPVSTATWAIWQPKVFTFMPSGFGPREPEPEIHAFPSLPVTSVIGWRSVPSTERISPSSSVRSEAEISNMSAARPRISVRTWWAADRTAGAIEASVIEPPEKGPCPIRDVSPAYTVIVSTGTPRRSATITAHAVIVPVPRSWKPHGDRGRAALPTRTSA